jgi:hypothetical protein
LHEEHDTDQRQDGPIYFAENLSLFLRCVGCGDFKYIAFFFGSGLHTVVMRRVLLGGLFHDDDVADLDWKAEVGPI